jgi:hypothetical protein
MKRDALSRGLMALVALGLAANLFLVAQRATGAPRNRTAPATPPAVIQVPQPAPASAPAPQATVVVQALDARHFVVVTREMRTVILNARRQRTRAIVPVVNYYSVAEDGSLSRSEYVQTPPGLSPLGAGVEGEADVEAEEGAGGGT